MTTTPTTEPEWTAGCSCGWRGMSEDAETHPCAWDEIEDDVRREIDYSLHKTIESAEMVREAGSTRPAEEVVKAIAEAREYLDQAEVLAVRELRLRRFTWAEVGHIFGISRQAAQQRFGSYRKPLS